MQLCRGRDGSAVEAQQDGGYSLRGTVADPGGGAGRPVPPPLAWSKKCFVLVVVVYTW